MKFCDVCGYNNLNEAVLCRHCGSELDVVMDAEEESIIIHTLYYSRNEIDDKLYEDINVVFPRDKYVFVLVTLFFVVLCGWSFFYSHWIYWFLLSIYLFLFMFRLIKIFFEWCGINVLSEYHGEMVKNDRLESFGLILGGFLSFLAPLCLWYNFKDIFMLFVIVDILFIFMCSFGIRVFFNNNSFNRVTGLMEIIVFLVFVILPGQIFFWMSYCYFVYKQVLSFSLFNVLLVFFDVLGFVSLVFFDKLNSFWPYDVRDGFGIVLLLVYAIFASFLPFLTLGSYCLGIWGW